MAILQSSATSNQMPAELEGKVGPLFLGQSDAVGGESAKTGRDEVTRLLQEERPQMKSAATDSASVTPGQRNDERYHQTCVAIEQKQTAKRRW